MLLESHAALSCVLDTLMRTRERDDVIRTAASRACRRASRMPHVRPPPAAASWRLRDRGDATGFQLPAVHGCRFGGAFSPSQARSCCVSC